MTAPVVLITGSSSGIGRSLCWEFHRQGHQVIATARQPEALADLKAVGMTTLALDVTQPDQIQQVVAQIQQQDRRLDILVNNAGYGLFGPLMDVSPAAIAQQFSTNVFAPLQMVQAIAPLMKAQGSGLILNVASVSSVLTTPFAGAYCSSKAALRALSDALRMELSPFGIQVVTVQPGAIASDFGHNAHLSLPAQSIAESCAESCAESWYEPLADKIQMRATWSQQNATSSQVFAQQLVQRVMKPPLSPEIWLGKKSLQFPLMKRWLPTKILESILKKRFGLTNKNL